MSLRRTAEEVVPKLARYRLAYSGIGKPPAPLNLTLSITYKCNSRCQSCDIWKIYPAEKERLKDELTLDEIERIFRTVGQVYFFNISGGEPFLRRDIVDIVRLACEHLRPGVVHIPTNALNPERVTRLTEEILVGMRQWGPDGVKLTLKPSFDGVGERHDVVRGVAGNWQKLVRTLGLLRDLRQRHDHLRVGVGTVISTMNIHELPQIIAQARAFDVDTYISEVAEEREEMRNLGSGITPTHQAYDRGIQPFRDETFERLKSARGMELLTQGMRHEYYDITRRWLRDRTQVIPCYAGLSNAHISPYGELWPCAILADSKSLGNLKEVDYDFWRLWHSERAAEVRASIRRRECDCPLANQAYGNMLLSPRSMARVAGTVARARFEALRERVRGAAPAAPPAATAADAAE
ncbi:MAG: radical SAM protein [Deltaproteobacteria bacterium]|nr:MAG: radical SAM protein [Deltaproteobacteria bacterium]